MATLPDVILDGVSYQNINVETGLTAGTNLIIQNKGSDSVRIIISPTQPDSSAKDGWLLVATKSIQVENESDFIWARCVDDADSVRLSVQPFI